MPPSQVAVLGECVADAFTEGNPDDGELTLRVLPGGSPANTAVALARLGTPTRFLGRLSDDAFGALFRMHLAASGVDLSGCVSTTEPSSLAIAAIDAEGQARYTFHTEGAADWGWTAEELGLDRLGAAACLHTGSLALIQAPAIEGFLAEAVTRATISIDPNVRPAFADPETYLAAIPTWCALADIVKLSEDDLIYLGERPESGFDAWHSAGARLIVVTLGARGALISLDGERAEIPAVPTTVVDTIGAGDAFTAGLLHHLSAHGLLGGRLDDLDLATATEAAAFAAKVAARTCAVAGANPPWPPV